MQKVHTTEKPAALAATIAVNKLTLTKEFFKAKDRAR
jgi:hypothetical protein